MTDDECTPVIRSQSPPNPTGVGLCGCYAHSVTYLFDECEGSADCKVARCASDACEGYEAYCDVNEDGRGLCSLRAADVSPTVVESTPISLNTYAWVGICTSDEECYPKMREAVPGESEVIGVSTCECYANSVIDPLDECQGDVACAMAMCISDSCDGRTAYCSAEGTCQLDGETETSAVDGGDDTGALNPCMEGQCLSPAGVCETEVACFVDPCDIDNGGCEGDCEANYCGGCNAVCLDSIASSSPTDVTVNRPSESTASVTQEPYTWEGPLCSTDNDCYSKIRERVPGESDTIGVTTCQCYANSFINPLDECQGESDMTCPIAGCMVNPCANAKAYCLVETGICYLEESTDSSPAATMPTITTDGSMSTNTPAVISSPATAITTPTDTIGNNDYTWTPTCTTDDDCYPTMRTDEPGESEPFGVAICECYANVFENPFDECQEDDTCISAMCLEYACEGITAFCSEQGLCELSIADGAAYNASNSIATILTSSTVMVSVISGTASNEVAEGLTNSTKPAADTTNETTSVTVDSIDIDGTEPTKVENVTSGFTTGGTSSSAATSTPNDSDLAGAGTDMLEVLTNGTELPETETRSSSTAADAVEIEVLNSKQNETITASQPSQSQGRPETNKTTQEIQLDTTTTATTATEEIVVNVTSDGNETLNNTTATQDETAVSENNLSESTSSEIDKSQEGIPLSSGMALDVMYSLIIGLAVANWMMLHI